MKLSYKNIYRSAFIGLLFVGMSCADESVGPVLEDSNTFVAPSLKNETTSATTVELLPDNASKTYEEFSWERANYGLQVSTAYVLQVDKTDAFENPKTLAESSTDKAAVTVEQMNNAMLALGLPGFEESQVFIRLKSSINGITNDPLYSAVITRKAKTYQNSECGNFCTVGIIGSATPGGWDVDTDLRLADATKADKSTWTTVIYLSTGAVKFRAMDDWTTNWGSANFPNGTGTQGGSDIPVANAGYYKVTFNDATGAYTFTALTTPTFASVGVIGSATAGGWDSDTDLVKDGTNPHLWTGTVTLATGEVKFRADNAWTNNWGAKTAPSGFGFLNGDNIPVAVAGTYAVRFNDATGEYALMPSSGATAFPTIGIIGTAQDGGWDTDTDMIKNPANPFLWSKIITIKDGEAKFRANNDWANNWGAGKFPSGIGTQDGANIPTKAGKYFVTFNSGTGEYYFLK